MYVVGRDLTTLRQCYQLLQLESLNTHLDRLASFKIRGRFLPLIDLINLLLKIILYLKPTSVRFVKEGKPHWMKIGIH